MRLKRILSILSKEENAFHFFPRGGKRDGKNQIGAALPYQNKH
jgi:hypothetical protein